MKKLGFIVMPLMVVSFLASCNSGGGDVPDPTVVHTLKYLYDNGTDKSFTEKYIDDEKTKEPTWAPTYAGHTFVGWYKEAGEGEVGTEFTFGSALIDNETTIHAHWDTNPPEPGITHNIYLDPCGGTFGQDQKEVIEKVTHNTPVEKAPVVTREGYEDPTWWYETDDGKAEFKFGKDGGTLVTHDYFLHADWGEEHPSKYSVSFIGDDCIGKCGTMTIGASEFQMDILYQDFNNIAITINPNTDYHLFNTDITVLKDGAVTTSQDDYTYEVSDSVGTVTLKSKGNFLVKIKATPDTPAETYTVTFDAGPGGKFLNGEQKISFKLDKGTKLLPFIKQLLTPTLEGQTFAYYEYEDKNNAIDYDDVVTSDITLKANYFASNTPKTDDLTKFDWKTIKNISVTGDPGQWFNIGATKKVAVNKKDHIIRIIDFDHDYSELPDDGSNPDPNKVLGITFEFANVITNADGNAATTIWNGEYLESGDNYDYRKSILNDFLNIDVLSMLPSSDDPDNPDLREVIKPVDKKVGVSTDEGQNYIATSFDGSEDYPYPYLFPLAHDEMANSEYFVTEGEGSKYQYYINHSNQLDRIKKKVGGGDIGEGYWLRSPKTVSSNLVWGVDGVDGSFDVPIVYHAFAVAPAFCI